MTIRVITPRPAVTPREALLDSIAAFVASEPALAQYFPADHPLLAFEFLHLSESLTFKVSLRSVPERFAIGCAAVFEMSTLALAEEAFALAFHSVVRALLFWQPEADLSRENLRLIDPQGQIEWDAVAAFVARALAPLPFACDREDTDEQIAFRLAPRPELGAVPLTLRMARQLMQATYGPMAAQSGHFRANEALKDHLLIQLTRLILQLMTPEQAAAHRERLAQHAASQAALRDPFYDQANPRDAAERLAQSLNQQIESLRL